MVMLSGFVTPVDGRYHGSVLESQHGLGLGSNVPATGIQHVELPARGANYKPFTDIIDAVAGQYPPPSQHTAFLRAQMSPKPSRSDPPSKSPRSLGSLKHLRVVLDSGCTSSCTGTLANLINLRPCKELYSQANGRLSYCSQEGDMPVFAKSSDGKWKRFTITNVRFVPATSNTLSSLSNSYGANRTSIADLLA